MANNNTVILIGNLGEDPKVYTKNGKSFTRLSVATTDSYKNKQTGAWMKRKPVWHTIFISFENLQEIALGYKKGDRIKVTGNLSYRRIKAADKGHMQAFSQATITAWKLERAPFPSRNNSEDSNDEVAA